MTPPDPPAVSLEVNCLLKLSSLWRDKCESIWPLRPFDAWYQENTYDMDYTQRLFNPFTLREAKTGLTILNVFF